MKKLLAIIELLILNLPIASAQVQEQWVARYNGPANSVDEARAVAVDVEANVYVTGTSVGIGTGADYATIRYDPDGNEVWVARYNGPASSTDVAYAMALDGAGNVYVTGFSLGVDTDYDYATVKYDSDGNELWVARYNGPGNSADFADAMAVDAAGNVYVTGGSTDVDGIQHYATIKYDPDGNEIWVARYNGPVNGEDQARAIAVDAAGNIYVTGYSVGIGTRADYATIRYDPDGNEVWVARYNGTANSSNFASAIAIHPAGNIYVTGWSCSVFGCEYATVQYDPDGNQVWAARYQGYAATAIAVNASGNAYVTGQSLGIVNYATVKYGLDGEEIWVAHYSGPTNRGSFAWAIGLDSTGNIYVTGGSEGVGTNRDYATIKYDPDGNEISVARYDGPASDFDEARAITLDAAGNVYVTGTSVGVGTNRDYATIKYSQE